jgi:Zn-dependent M28 family amino/carboxypeptidase
LTEEELRLKSTLRADVEMLAGEIGERNVFHAPKLEAAARYIETEFVKAGWRVEHHRYEVHGVSCDNLEVTLPGSSRAQESIVVGAHYDSVSGCAGANDNGSGVAGLLALGRLWQGRSPALTVRFVAFVNEEPSFFHTEQMGSLVYARRCQARGDHIVGMLALETIGFYSSEPGSQKYPFPVGLFYPSHGDFLAFVGDHSSRRFIRRCVGAFRRRTSFPSEGAALPRALPGIGWSDHWSFWQVGYPALMLTDTAPFRYPHYHTVEDTPDKLDYERTARVVAGVDRLVQDLANP